jgi:hypothetical protein
MEVKVQVIEGERIQAGDTLVVIPPRELSSYAVERYHQAAKKLGIHMLFLPPHSRLYIKERDNG